MLKTLTTFKSVEHPTYLYITQTCVAEHSVRKEIVIVFKNWKWRVVLLMVREDSKEAIRGVSAGFEVHHL